MLASFSLAALPWPPQAPYSAQHKVSPTLRVLEAPSGLDAQAPTTNPPGAPNTTHEDADGRGFNVSGGSGGGVAAPNPSRRSLRSANSATAAGAHDKQNPVDANRHVKQGSGALAARHQLLKSMNSFHSTKNGNGVERKHFSGGGEPGRDVGGGFNEEEQRKHQPTRGRILEEGDGNARLYGNGTAGPNAAPRALLYELEVEVLPAVLTAADLARAEEAWPGLMAQAVWGGDGGNDGGSGLAAAAPAAAKAAGCWPVVRAPRDHDGAVLGGSVAGGTYLLVGLCEQVGGGMGVGMGQPVRRRCTSYHVWLPCAPCVARAGPGPYLPHSVYTHSCVLPAGVARAGLAAGPRLPHFSMHTPIHICTVTLHAYVCCRVFFQTVARSGPGPRLPVAVLRAVGGVGGATAQGAEPQPGQQHHLADRWVRREER